MKTRVKSITSRVIATVGVMALLCAAGASAQKFEHHYEALNPGGQNDEGTGGVQLVSNGGYIAVGHGFNGSNQDILVVRTNHDGTTIWKNRYDFNGNHEYGWDIRECSSGGFVLVGTVFPSQGTPPQPRDIIIVRLAANGAVTWAKRYSNANWDEEAFCIQEATIDPGSNGAVGDFIVAGYRSTGGPLNPATRREAIILRVSSTGAVQWWQNYPLSPDFDNTVFKFVKEATINTGSAADGAGELIAVGVAQSMASDDQAFAVRVNGNDGSFTGSSKLGAMLWGNNDEEIFVGVEELSAGSSSSTAGDIVLLGWRYSNPSQPTSIHGFVVRTAPDLLNTSGALAAIHFDGEDFVPRPYWIKEIRVTSTGLNTGDLLVCGESVYSEGAQIGFLLELQPGALTPNGINYIRTGVVYTPSSARSVEVVDAALPGRSAGFVVCGKTRSNTNLHDNLLLIKTDVNGANGCTTDPYDMRYDVEDLGEEISVARPEHPTWTPTETEISVYGGSDVRICFYYDGTSAKLVIGGAQGSTGENDLSAYPNPIERDRPLILELVLERSASVSVEVSDMTGARVFSETKELRAGSVEIPVETRGWTPGSYLVTVKCDGKTATSRIVVTE